LNQSVANITYINEAEIALTMDYPAIGEIFEASFQERLDCEPGAISQSGNLNLSATSKFHDSHDS